MSTEILLFYVTCFLQGAQNDITCKHILFAVLLLLYYVSHARWKKEFGWQRKLTPHLIVLPRIDKGATASKHAIPLVQVILTSVVEGIVTLTDSVSGLVVCCTGMSVELLSVSNTSISRSPRFTRSVSSSATT